MKRSYLAVGSLALLTFGFGAQACTSNDGEQSSDDPGASVGGQVGTGGSSTGKGGTSGKGGATAAGGKAGSSAGGKAGSSAGGKGGAAQAGHGGTSSPGGKGGAGGAPAAGAGGHPAQGQGGSPTQGQGGSPTQGQGGDPTQGQGGDPTQGQGGDPTQGQGGDPTQGQGGDPTQGQGGDPTQGQGGDPTQGQGGNPQGLGGMGTGGACTPIQGGGIFEAPEPWNKDVSCDPVAAESAAIIAALSASGGWPKGKLLNEGSIGIQFVDDASGIMHTFQHTGDFYDPDCDDVQMPVPAGGHVEGESGYDCQNDGDCHLIVVDKKTKKLYEMWRAFTPAGGSYSGGCSVVWDLTKAYPDNLRGDGCTSADGGGFPLAAMVFTADEVFAGSIPHAIRFILPNARIRHHMYVHPGTHSTGPTNGGPDAPPYGVRLRLRADYPLSSLPNDGARVVAQAMQRYGMLLADGGNVDGLSRADDSYTTHKWTEVGIDDTTLQGLLVEDFEVVDFGTPMDGVATDCTRNP